MDTAGTKFNTIDNYIAGFPKETQELLEQIRVTIRKAAPEAEEVISYQMAAFRHHRILVYFAGFKNHIGFYPGASGVEAFKKELSVYKSGKGSIQFPLNKPIPSELITRIVKFRVNENLNPSKTKKK
jgi:uncharacterized protein YdhG (YjbR/CyaY superfamily)